MRLTVPRPSFPGVAAGSLYHCETLRDSVWRSVPVSARGQCGELDPWMSQLGPTVPVIINITLVNQRDSEGRYRNTASRTTEVKGSQPTMRGAEGVLGLLNV